MQFDFMTLKGLLKKRSKRWCFLACFAVEIKKDFTRFSSKHIILLYSVLLYILDDVVYEFPPQDNVSGIFNCFLFFFFWSISLLPLLLEFESEYDLWPICNLISRLLKALKLIQTMKSKLRESCKTEEK